MSPTFLLKENHKMTWKWTAIDTVKKVVTFSNNGVVQEIPLTAGVASGGGSAPSSAQLYIAAAFRDDSSVGLVFGGPGGESRKSSGRLSASSGQ